MIDWLYHGCEARLQSVRRILGDPKSRRHVAVITKLAAELDYVEILKRYRRWILKAHKQVPQRKINLKITTLKLVKEGKIQLHVFWKYTGQYKHNYTYFGSAQYITLQREHIRRLAEAVTIANKPITGKTNLLRYIWALGRVLGELDNIKSEIDATEDG